ncbi:beta-lactamase/transpeptidase-like protein, partial [Aaosphaeria arxii CBS 175.79]
APAFADFGGPRYPFPKDLTSNKSYIPEAWKTITSTLEKALSAGPNATIGETPGLSNLTFSLGLFSLEDESVSESQFHYTSPVIQASNGTTKVDENSLYQVASITKVFSVLAGKLNLKPADWDTPLTELFPVIAELAEKLSKEDNAEYIQWDKITPAVLASQQSGIPTNPISLDLLVGYLTKGTNPLEDGFPVFDFETDPLSAVPCEDVYSNITCFFPNLAPRGPNHLPWSGPLYSNNGFILLTAALQNITGKSIPELFAESIYGPLGLESTFTTPIPEAELGRTVFYDPAEVLSPASLTAGSGGVVSSLHDINQFGAGILNSTILPSEETHRWLKPGAHTDRFEFAMGQPWEILRWTHESGAVTDLYTKGGDSGTAGTFLVLVPDYNFGFTILGSSPDLATKIAIVQALGDFISATLLPALEKQAQAEAEHNFAGTYFTSNNGTNSTLILSVNKTEGAAPGLLIDQYLANGVDFQTTEPFYFAPGARLQPTILTSGTGKLGFRVATAADAPGVDKSKTLFSGAGRANFLVGDAIAYGGNSLSQFVIEIDEQGKATGVTPTALRTTLKRAE